MSFKDRMGDSSPVVYGEDGVCKSPEWLKGLTIAEVGALTLDQLRKLKAEWDAQQ